MKRKYKCPLDVVEEFFGGDERKARAWWITPNRLLGGYDPREMNQTERGMLIVERLIRNQLADNRPRKKT